VVSRFIK